MHKSSHTFQIVFTHESEGGFTVTVPALPGCISFGKTIEEARTMITEAISAYLASMNKHKQSNDDTLVELQNSNTFVSTVTI